MITLHKGEVLFHQGDNSLLYRLQSGLLKVVRIQSDGSQFLFNLLTPDEMFPHHSLVTPQPNFGTAIAVLDSHIEPIPAAEWYAELEANPQRYREIAISLQEKLRIMQQRIDMLATIPASRRLDALREWFSNRFEDIPLEQLLTQEEISQFIGLRRETINRLLNRTE